MNTLANKIAISIKRANPEYTHSIEIMQYSLGIMLNTLFIIIMTAIIGALSGRFVDSIFFLFSFSLLRLCSGGFHLKTAQACNVASILLSTIGAHLFHFPTQILLIINAFSLLIMILFAPNPDINAQIPSRMFPSLKLISILLVSSNFFINSSVVGLAFFIQSLTVIPWIRRTR